MPSVGAVLCVYVDVKQKWCIHIIARYIPQCTLVTAIACKSRVIKLMADPAAKCHARYSEKGNPGLFFAQMNRIAARGRFEKSI